MKTYTMGLIAFFISFSAMAGGMIGGGEVTFKSLVICDASSIDPTHESSPYVWVVKEVDYNGNFIHDATLRVVTVDENLAPVQFYVTHAKDIVQDPSLNWLLSIWNYDIGSAGNQQIGEFEWNSVSNSGSLKSFDSYVEELLLSNCIFEQE